MFDQKGPEHKSKAQKQDFVTPLQKNIILFLAVNNPQTINETVKATKGNYRSSWDAYKELKKKEMIKEINLKKYRGREYPRFWLTDLGVLFALSEKVKPDVLLRRTQQIYPEDTNLQFLVEGLPILGENALNMLHLALLTNGKIEQSDLIPILASQKKLTDKENKRYIAITKKYPGIYKRHVDGIKEASKNLKDLSEKFEA